DNTVRANRGDGIALMGPGNVIRDNTVRANRGDGIALMGPGVVTGNLIVGNDRHGIFIHNGSEPITISQNVVIQNGGDGMYLHGSCISVFTNYIGTDQDANALGNQQAGIYIYDGSDNKIGGPGNTIANNLGAGIVVLSGQNHDLADNIIYNNGGLGIDLGDDGPTANDPGDSDNGPNNLQNYPVLTGALSAGNVITGTLVSQPDSQFEVSLFANHSCNVSRYGGGEELLGRIMVTTNSSGEAVFNAAYPEASPGGRVITALATSLDGNTSEFSRCRVFDQSSALLPVILSQFCVTFLDDFSNPASGWSIGETKDVRYGYLAGEYQIFTKNPDYYYVFRSPSCERENYVIEVDARWASSPGASYGMVFGITENYGRYYLFNVNANAGQYSLYRKDGPGLLVTLVWPTDSVAINAGSASNHLRVTRSGRQITLEVNGTLVHEMYDSSISGHTGAGIAVIPYLDLPNADARFDNFLSDGISPTALSSEPAAGTAANTVELDARLPEEWTESMPE
ncbi:MAG: right-handed parallel beta-helix repeat-containing protein, partial [Candidatus Promineifilaceae bacterium]